MRKMNGSAIDLANTTYAVRGKLRDAIATPAELATWLSLPSVTEAEFAEFREVREAIRAVAGEDLTQAGVLNRASARAPRWPELTPDGRLVERDEATPAVSALAALARDAITLLGGPSRSDVRFCAGPGCVLLFVKEHPRQEWCSPACGNRARAARHYRRHR